MQSYFESLSDKAFALHYMAFFFLILLALWAFSNYFGEKKEYLPPPRKDHRVGSVKQKW